MSRPKDFSRDRCSKVLNNYFKDNSSKIIKNLDFTRHQYDSLFCKPSYTSSHNKRQQVVSQNIEIDRNNLCQCKIPKIINEVIEQSTNQNACEIPNETVFNDKTTYCRPVTNLYSQQFLYNTIEQNAKLERLVKELMLARQQEKEAEIWNKYINELRKKHGFHINMKAEPPLHYEQEGIIASEYIQDYNNVRFTCKHSNSCNKVVQDIYNVHDIRKSDYTSYKMSKEYEQMDTKKYSPFERDTLCYPISSQGRLILLERERQKQLLNHGYKPFFTPISEESKPNINICNKENYLKKPNQKYFPVDKNFIFNSRGTNTIVKTTSTQTEFKTISIHAKIDSVQQIKNITVPEEIGSVKSNYIDLLQSNDNILKQNCLANIEDKLDSLIRSISNFIVEIKTKKCKRHKNIDTSKPIKLGKRTVNLTQSDCCGIATKEKVVCGLIDNSSITTGDSSDTKFNRSRQIGFKNVVKNFQQQYENSKLIILKDSSAGEIYHPCSVQISVTIPTKDISTEVTRSLVKAEKSSGDNNLETKGIGSSREDRQIAIAVNTDPISLLALLRVSTEETIRRFLSYVPSIDYYYFLSRLHGPSPRALESQFVCNICGAAFSKPSELTDHIQKHELGMTRDCCVCRHVLDMPRKKPGLFKCRYCGHRFTRAYCCELHQQSCARRFGMSHDVKSSLMLLR